MIKKEFVKHLEAIIKLLKEEKKLLVENKGQALMEIIDRKYIYINDLEIIFNIIVFLANPFFY